MYDSICGTTYIWLAPRLLCLAKIPAYLLITIIVSVPNECMILIPTFIIEHAKRKAIKLVLIAAPFERRSLTHKYDQETSDLPNNEQHVS